MATVTSTKFSFPNDRRVVIRGISWETYGRLVQESEGHGSVRLAYDRGALELMSPSPLHERFKQFFCIIVLEVATGLGLDCESYGSTTWRRDDIERGLESDECFYFDPEKLAQFFGRVPDRPNDPVPDLAVEIDLSTSELDRPSIYASLGVPEVWRYDGDRLQIDVLQPTGSYREVETSQFLPLQGHDILTLIELARDYEPNVLEPARPETGFKKI